MTQFDSERRLRPGGKLLGVMAQTAKMTGANATWLRIGAVAMLALAFKLTVVAYCVAAIALRLARD